MILVKTLFMILCLCLIIIQLYSFYYYKYDENTITSDLEETARRLTNHPIHSLMDGSGINNIPNLNIISTNIQVTQANKCGQGPVYIGRSENNYKDYDCIKLCANSSAKVITVLDDELYAFENKTLKPGAHCHIGPRPECNTKTTHVLMTINSVVCRPKNPRLFGGPTGNTIIACNDKNIYDPRNILWDYEKNEPVNPMTLNSYIMDVDEIASDGSLRYRCKFEGIDDKGNYFIENPHDRFHPIVNYCANLIYNAHPDIITKFNKDANDYECVCGDEEVTRVKHMYPDNIKSQCSSIQYSEQIIDKKKMKITIPYKCFSLYSTIDQVGSLPPCPPEQFTREGNQVSSIDLILTKNENEIIEHPNYSKLSSEGLFINREQIN